MVTSSGDAGGAGRVFMRVVKEPLVHFLLVGVVLWVASSHYRAAHDDYRIVVTAQTIERIKADYRAEYGSEPAPERLRNLVNAYVDGEILYREGQARGLAADDEIVRRRIIQKTAFMIEGVDTPTPPSDDVLRAWYDARAEKYASPGLCCVMRRWDSLRESRCVGGGDAQAISTEIPYDQLERI